MIGDYTRGELAALSREDFEAASAREFAKPVTQEAVAALYAEGRSLPEHLTGRRVEDVRVNLGSSVPKPQPGANVWASNKMAAYDFTCPSGQTCRLRKLQPEELLEGGILDQITRLEGIAADLVNTAEGQPPTPSKMPSHADFQMVLDVLNTVVPLAVVEPKVYPDADAPEGSIRVSDIDLADRMAIMEESLKSLRALDRFRNP
jgi:hypothetical protein